VDADHLSQAKQKALEALEIGGGHQQAAEAAGVSRMTLWRWRRENPEFCAAWQQDEDTGCDVLEDVLRQCALNAFENPKYQTSLIFTLKNRRPARWNERRNVHVSGGLGVGGDPDAFKNLSDEELEHILRAIAPDPPSPDAVNPDPLDSAAPAAATAVAGVTNVTR